MTSYKFCRIHWYAGPNKVVTELDNLRLHGLQWGYEIQISLDFKRSKRGWVVNCPDFEWDLKSGSPTILKSGQVATILSKTKKSGFQIFPYFEWSDFRSPLYFNEGASLLRWPLQDHQVFWLSSIQMPRTMSYGVQCWNAIVEIYSIPWKAMKENQH